MTVRIFTCLENGSCVLFRVGSSTILLGLSSTPSLILIRNCLLSTFYRCSGIHRIILSNNRIDINLLYQFSKKPSSVFPIYFQTESYGTSLFFLDFFGYFNEIGNIEYNQKEALFDEMRDFLNFRD